MFGLKLYWRCGETQLQVGEKWTLSPLNHNVIKCLSAELIIFLIKNSKYITDKGDIRCLPCGRLSPPPAVKWLNKITRKRLILLEERQISRRALFLGFFFTTSGHIKRQICQRYWLRNIFKPTTTIKLVETYPFTKSKNHFGTFFNAYDMTQSVILDNLVGEWVNLTILRPWHEFRWFSKFIDWVILHTLSWKCSVLKLCTRLHTKRIAAPEP